MPDNVVSLHDREPNDPRAFDRIFSQGQPRPAPRKQGEDHLSAAAIARCDFCDEDGYRSGVVCDHVDRTETARAGAALVRAALAKHTPDDQEDTDA